MNRKTTLTFIFFLITFCSFANYGQVGNLSILSEKGSEFFLFLNGRKQNDLPQTRIRIEGLQQIRYDVKIVFANKNLMPIFKNNLAVADANGDLYDVTYRLIKTRRQQSMSLNFYSMMESGSDYNSPNTIYTVYFHDQTFPNHFQNGNISYDLPMRTEDFSTAMQTVESMKFEDSKFTVAKQIVDSNRLSANQIIKMAQLFNFEDTKLDFAKYAYKFCTDQNNYYKLNSIFKFSSNAEKLIAFIG